MTRREEGGGGYNVRRSGGELHNESGGTTTWVVDGFWWRLRTTWYGIGRGTIEKVKSYVWVHWRRLGVDGGGGGGRQRRGSGGGDFYFLRMGHDVIVGSDSEVRRLGLL
jgi:hypothetical protein